MLLKVPIDGSKPPKDVCMYYDIITKEIFDSYIENDSDFVLEGISTDTFGKTTFRRFVRVPLAMGEHYIEALYEHNFGSFPLSMGTDHFSFKKNLEFMAFIVDRKEICCKSFPFVQLFEDYKKADSNWVTDEMVKRFISHIEKTYTPSAEVMKNKKFQSLTYDSAVKQYVYDRSNDTTLLDVMLKLLEKFDDSVIIDYLANPTGWEERFAKALEQSGIWDSFAKELAEPFVAYLVQTRQYLDTFSADPSCWESISKNLMAAVKDRKTVRLNIEAGGKSMQVVYHAVGIESYDAIRTKSLDTFAISPARHQEEVEHFLEENCQGYGRRHRHSIPFKVIVSVSSGRKVLWENPLFGK